MLLRLLGLVFVVLSPAKPLGEPLAATQPAAAPEPAAPRRAKVTCAEYRASAERHAKNAMFNTKLKPAAWGGVPAPLRNLPPRAKLCGADRMGQVVIASPLYGKDVETHYTPLFTKIGFGPLACKVVDGRTQCTCKRNRDIGIVVTDHDSQAFVLSVMKR